MIDGLIQAAGVRLRIGGYDQAVQEAAFARRVAILQAEVTRQTTARHEAAVVQRRKSLRQVG